MKKNKSIPYYHKTNNINKWCFSADGSSLLPSALRPHLLMHSRIVVMSTILGAFLVSFLANLFVAETNVSAASLTLTLPESFSLSLTPNGSFQSGSNTSLKVATDASGGFNLSMKGSSSDNSLKNGSNSLKSISSTLSESSYKSSGNNNTWGFKPSYYKNSTNSDFQPAPGTTEVQIAETNSANTSGVSYNIALGAKVDNTVPSGKYKNTFTFLATANEGSYTYTINYNVNGGSNGPSNVSNATTNRDTVTLSSTYPSRSGYTFKGWCTNNTEANNGVCSSSNTYQPGSSYKLTGEKTTINLYATWLLTGTYSITYNLNGGSNGPSNVSSKSIMSNNVTLENKTPTKSNYDFMGWCDSSVSASTQYTTYPCSGTTYKPNGTITLTTDKKSFTLYAMWRYNATRSVGSLGYMQSFTSTYCSTSSSAKLRYIGDYGTATDRRDNNTYTIAKLADGKCWMVDNLRIAGRSINSTYSDMSSGSYTIPASNAKNFPEGVDNSNNAYVDSTYGGYYTWYTATAGTGTSSVSSGNASSSICPKGWKLPTGGSGGDFQIMARSYGSGTDSATSAALRATPVPNFLRGGWYYDSSPNGVGSAGSYWTSTALNSNDAYGLYFDASSVIPTYNIGKYRGRQVRCVLR